jgi:BirA family biotin operon repressor/biotin-[acetyl-CoA-carboxylase] ligase
MIIGSNIIFYDELTSTNNKASELLRVQEVAEGTVVNTDFQSAGRGQAGNKWESSQGKNLLFSIVIYPNSIIPEEQFLISMTISLGICDFIDSYIKGSKIKWPNDIYVNNDKIAGILIENSIIGENIENSVVGIGFNLNQEKFSHNIPNPVSLKKLTGNIYERQTCLIDLLENLDKRYKTLLYGDREPILCEYNSRIYRYNIWSNFLTGGKVFTGRIKDVSLSGSLVVEDKAGNSCTYTFKEIEYII